MPDRTCNQDGCTSNRPAIARGMCTRCYSRWHYHAKGSADIGFQRRGADPAERFHAKVEPQPDGCRHWTGAVNAYGYGVFQLAPRQSIQAHIYAWMLAHDGERPPEGTQLDHTCHDPATCAGGNTDPHRRCVNDEHLTPKTPRANTLNSNAPSALNAVKTHCPQGHPYDEWNTTRSSGRRKCKACARIRARMKSLGISFEASEAMDPVYGSDIT